MTKRVHMLQRSFAGGRLSQDMFGRIDLTKYPVSLAECENFVVAPHGPMRNRAGFEFIAEVRDSTKTARLLPFSFSDSQTYLIILNGQRIGFSTDQGIVVSAAQAISVSWNAAAAKFRTTVSPHGRTTGDVIYVTGIPGFDEYTYKVGASFDADEFYVLHMDGTAVDSTLFDAYVSGGTIEAAYVKTTTFADDELFDIGYCQSADVMTLTHTAHPVQELARVSAANWTLSNVTFAPAIAAPTMGAVTESVVASGYNYYYVVTAVAEDGLEESLPSSEGLINSDLSATGQIITVNWTAVTGAVRYNVYKDDNGLFGYIGATENVYFNDNNITPDVGLVPPRANNPFGSTDNYPRTVCYFEQRRVFANTNTRPNNLWMTQSATESNMCSTIPTQDNDAIQIRIAARELNEVMHVVPMTDLLSLTNSSEWMLTTREGYALTPANISPREQAHGGSNKVHPVLAANATVYARAVGGHIMSISIASDSASGGYKTEDLSILATDLFDGLEIIDMAYSSAPVQTVWAVRSDGVLLGLTYYPEHEVFGWHTHTTDGLFESVCVIRELGEDYLYAIVGRTIDGRYRRYVERMASRMDVDIEDGVFCDSAFVYSGVSTSTITGLHHLEGEAVEVLADGVSYTNTVVDGSITLEVPATKVIVGLPYTSRAVSMPMVSDQLPAGGVGFKKSIVSMNVRLRNSSTISVGAIVGGENVVLPERINEPYGTAPALKNGVFVIDDINSDYAYDIQYVIEHTGPLPCTVSSVLLNVAVAES